MTANEVLRLQETGFRDNSKAELRQMLEVVCDQLKQERDLHQEEVTQLQKTLAAAKEEQEKATEREINRTVNQPSSKKAEWDKEKTPKCSRRKKRPGRPWRRQSSQAYPR